MAGGPIGNKKGIKLKDADIRQLAYDSYCAHLAQGKSQRSWVFEHEQYSCTHETIEKYIQDEAEFDPKKKKTALAKGFAKWEHICEGSADGSNKKANTASLQMVMRNKFGWDKHQAIHDEYRGDIRSLAEEIRNGYSKPETENCNSSVE